MNFIEAIYQQVDFIKNDYFNGSSTIALNALDVLTAAIDVQGMADDSFPVKIASLLKESKPSMASVSVICDYTLNDFRNSRQFNTKYFTIDVREKLLRASENSVNKANKDLLKEKSSPLHVTTCSFSTNVLRFLKLADKRGYRIHVTIIDSVWNKRNYASMLAYELNNTGILSKIITLEDFEVFRDNVDFCLIGADGFDAKGNIVNGVPSKELLRLARNHTDVFVIAESFKKVDQPVPDDGFEYIPSEFVKKIFTDEELWQ